MPAPKGSKHNYRHGHTPAGKEISPTYSSWASLKRRCLDKNNRSYKDYGAKGVEVCERWLTFVNFLSDMGVRPGSEYVISRKEDTGNYEPGNCEWKLKFDNDSEAKTGSRNPNTHFKERDIKVVFDLSGQGLSQREIGRRLGVHQSTISRILNKKN